MRLLITLISIVLIADVVSACFNPTDYFAFEVLLNKPGVKYDLSPLLKAKNIVLKDDTIIYRSHYCRDVAVILKTLEKPLKGLSVRIQIPTKTVAISYNITTVESTTNRKIEIDEDLAKSLGYKVIKRDGAIFAEKDGIRISVIDNRLQAFIRNGDIEEVKSIAKLTDDEWRKARVEVKTIKDYDLKPYYDYLKDFDFKKAIKVELEWLRDNRIVKGLSYSDVQAISSIAKAGLAGHNSRVVWENGWKPYYETSNPLLLKSFDCGGFPIDELPSGELMLKSDYGLVMAVVIPIVVVLMLLLLKR